MVEPSFPAFLYFAEEEIDFFYGDRNDLEKVLEQENLYQSGKLTGEGLAAAIKAVESNIIDYNVEKVYEDFLKAVEEIEKSENLNASLTETQIPEDMPEFSEDSKRWDRKTSNHYNGDKILEIFYRESDNGMWDSTTTSTAKTILRDGETIYSFSSQW